MSWLEEYNSSPTMQRNFSLLIEFFTRNNKTVDCDRKEKHLERECRLYKERKHKFPCRKLYNKIVNNSIAVRVLDSTFSEPKFKVGKYVEIFYPTPNEVDWVNNLFIKRKKLMKKLAIVMETDAGPVRTGTKASKLYKLFFPQILEFIVIEEKYLRLCKKFEK